MSAHSPDVRQQVGRWLPRDLSAAQQVTLAATLLIAVQLAFRAWAVLGGWFHADDFAVLSSTRDPGISVLGDAVGHELHPASLAIAWVVSHVGAFVWPVAAASTLLLQAVASWAAWHMLSTVFGHRRAALVPLALYLFSPLTLTATMWWSASINQLPVQAALFVAIAAHVRLVGSPTLRDAAVVVGAIVVGLAFDPKAVLIAPLLLVLTVAVLGDGTGPRRMWHAVRRVWWIWPVYVAVVGGYAAIVLARVPTPLTAIDGSQLPELLRSTGLTVLVPALVGGPLDWTVVDTPAAVADPAPWFVVVSLVVVLITTAHAVRTRTRVVGALIVLALYTVADALLLAARPGADALDLAAEPRFLADVAPVAALVLGLMFLPVVTPGVRGGAARRPGRRSPAPRRAVAAVLVAATLASVVSSIAYIRPWHGDQPARVFVENVTSTTRRTGDVDVVDVDVPGTVLHRSLSPYTLTSRFFNGDQRVNARTSGNDLRIFDRGGFARIPRPTGGVTSPTPAAGECGVLYSTVSTGPAASRREPSIDLSGRSSSRGTWLTVDYLASAEGTVTLQTGTESTTIDVLRGAHTYVLRPPEETDSVTFTELTPDTTLCIGRVSVSALAASRFS